MDVYVPLTIFLILLNLVNRNTRTAKLTFSFSMLSLAIFCAFRYDFGPDYQSYLRIYNDIKGYDLPEMRKSEFIFYSFLKIFPNYTSFIITSTFIWFYVYYKFFSKYITENNYWIFLLYFCYTDACIILSMVALRSAMFAILFVLAVNLLLRGKKLLYVFVIIIGTFIHNTSVVFLPLVFIGSKQWKWVSSNIFIVLIFLITIILLLQGHYSMMLFFTSILTTSIEGSSNFTTYADMMLQSTNSSFLTQFVFKILVFIPFISICKSFNYEFDERFIIFNKLALIMSILILLLGQGMMVRFYMVLSAFYIVALLRSKRYNGKIQNRIAIFSILLLNAFLFYHSMQASYNVSFLNYKSVISLCAL